MIRCRLKVILAEKDLQQKDLVKMTGGQANTISKMCRNEIKHIPVDTLNAICESLQIQPGDLFIYQNEND